MELVTSARVWVVQCCQTQMATERAGQSCCACGGCGCGSRWGYLFSREWQLRVEGEGRRDQLSRALLAGRVLYQFAVQTAGMARSAGTQTGRHAHPTSWLPD